MWRRSTRSSIMVMAIFLGCVGAAASAAPPPPLEPGALPDAPAGTRLIIPLRELSQSQRGAVEKFQAERLTEASRVMKRLPDSKARGLEGAYAFESDDSYVNQLDGVVRKVVPLSALGDKVKVRLANADNPEFSGLVLRGYVPEGLARDGPWTWISRVYSARDGSLVKLSEWNFVDDGGSVTIIPELRNAEVSGVPAELTVAVASSGKQLWILRWETPTKVCMLYYAPPAGRGDARERMLGMARSLRE